MVRVYAGGAKLGGGLAPTLDRGPKRGLSLRQGERDILVVDRVGPSPEYSKDAGHCSNKLPETTN